MEPIPSYYEDYCSTCNKEISITSEFLTTQNFCSDECIAEWKLDEAWRARDHYRSGFLQYLRDKKQTPSTVTH